MKLAVSSAAFAPLLRNQELTQLEWLDQCAHDYDVDGVVFDLAHFPRRDGEYLAQLKKIAVDGGLAVAGLEARAFFEIEDADREGIIADAAALGAPLVVAPLGPPTEVPITGYNACVRAGKVAARAAKAANVTLAIRNASASIGASSAELKRFTKDIDSAWVRFALDVDELSDEERALLEERSVIAYASDFFRTLGGFRAFICVEYEGADPQRELAPLLERARRELFEGRRPPLPSSYLV